MFNFDYARPLSVQAAVATMNKDLSSQFIAGGTNLVDLMKRGVASPQKLIDITGLPLNKIEMKGDKNFTFKLVNGSKDDPTLSFSR